MYKLWYTVKYKEIELHHGNMFVELLVCNRV